MKPIFTVHAGEFLVGSYLERHFPQYRLWLPTRDTGQDLLVTNADCSKAVSLQVKFSKDFLATHMADAFHRGLKACGWFTPNTKKIRESAADLWVFALYRLGHTELDYVIIPPAKVLKKLTAIHGKSHRTIQSYIWVTKSGRCWESRGLKRADQLRIADGTYKDGARDLTPYLNNWTPLVSTLS